MVEPNEGKEEKLAEDSRNEPTDEQMYSAFSFCVMLVLVGIPLWWKTTEVYRVSLPYSEIDVLHELNFRIKMNVHIVTIDDTHGAALINNLKNIFKISKLYEINYKQHSFAKSVFSSSKTIQEIEEKIKHPHFEGSLQLYEVPGLSRFTPKNIIIGQNRTIYFSSDTDAFKLYNFLKTKILNEASLLNTILHITDPMKTSLDKDSKRKISTSDEFDILFTIINQDPEFLRVRFDIAEAIEEYISPFLKNLEDMNGFHVKSQWLHFINLEVKPKLIYSPDKGPHYALSEDLLPHVITPLEKKLASHVSKHPCLNFVLFIPSCALSPLHIYTKKGFQVDGANAFISPRWGGIQIHGPDKKTCEANKSVIFEPSKHHVMSVFLQQLRLLLGIPEPNEIEQEGNVINAPVNLRLWEKDSLLRSRTVEQLTSAKLTLQSLSKLLGKISNIVINDQVGEAVYLALESIYNATNALNNGRLMEAYQSSKKAFLASETAFTDPSLLALLYFPDDQKYAVYIPLFLPIMIPVLISFKQIWVWADKKFKNPSKCKIN